MLLFFIRMAKVHDGSRRWPGFDTPSLCRSWSARDALRGVAMFGPVGWRWDKHVLSRVRGAARCLSSLCSGWRSMHDSARQNSFLAYDVDRSGARIRDRVGSGSLSRRQARRGCVSHRKSL